MIYKLNIQIQISLMIGNLYSADHDYNNNNNKDFNYFRTVTHSAVMVYKGLYSFLLEQGWATMARGPHAECFYVTRQELLSSIKHSPVILIF